MHEVVENIAQEIKTRGAITFARFMEVALYCPVYGYYETEEDTIGRRGDYYTSVSTGSLFGELLALQFSRWLEASDASDRVQIVEAGAHDGWLAKDTLCWMREARPELFARLKYWIIEPSPRRREWQRAKLGELAAQVHWAGGLTEPGEIRGIIFANELLDALPTHRMGWDATNRAWFEWGVRLEGGHFVWTRMDGEPSVDLPDLPDELLAVLPDGFTTEICLLARKWWRQAAGALAGGKLLTIDYGLMADEVFRAERMNGTARAYRRHRLSDDLLAFAGEQDITAHVNFSAIRAAGELAGLRTETLVTQGQFLTEVAALVWQGKAAFGPWTPERTRQFQTLTHPEHLGRPFRVLVQGRGNW